MAKSHPKSLTNSIAATPQSRIMELNLGRLPYIILTAAVTHLPGPEVPDAINIITTASSPGQIGPGRPESTCQINEGRPVTTASPTHTTPYHATRCCREATRWLPTSLITAPDGAISWVIGQKRVDPPRLPYDRAVNSQSHLHVRAHEVAGWRAGWLNCRML